jgi:hypothetical protein
MLEVSYTAYFGYIRNARLAWTGLYNTYDMIHDNGGEIPILRQSPVLFFNIQAALL